MPDRLATAPQAQNDDYDLMRRITAREQSAFSVLYDRHSGLVFTICQRVLGNRAEAEDLLVDVFWELWDRAERYDPSRGSPVTYLVTLARSRSIDRFRNRGPVTAELKLAGGNEPVESQSPETPSMQSETRAAVVSALAELEPQQRSAIECAFYQGLSHSDIAKKPR